MLTQTPTTTTPNPVPGPTKVRPTEVSPTQAPVTRASLARAPLNRWAGMPAMSGFFRSGDPLLDLRDRFDRAFDSVFGGDLMPTGWFARAEALPKVDLAESDAALTLTADLPGMAATDITLTVADNVLTLSGERKAESAQTDHRYRVVERSHGRFTRSFQLPDRVEVDRITASFDKGVLTVTLPKTEPPAVAVKRIPIAG